MGRARAIASLALAVLFIVAPALALYVHTPLMASALQPNTQIKVYPYKIVKGQDVLFTVVQTGGAFTPGATLYVKVKNQNSWGTGSGYAWIGLPSGTSTIPKGSYFFLPADEDLTDLLGSNYLSTGAAYFLVSDSSDGSTGVTGAQISVVSLPEAPYIHVGYTTYNPSDILSVSYTSNSLPEFTVQQKPYEASPGDKVTLYYYVPGNTVYFYWDYYGGKLLATGKGGEGEVTITIPDAPEGFHFIVAVSDEGYGAFNVIYVKPTLIASQFSIQGKAGETVTFTGRGFPANAELDTTTYVELTVSDGVNTGTMRAEIISGGVADSLGRMTLTIKLIDNKPPTVKGGLVDVKLYYKSGDIDDVVGGTFYQGQLGPAGDGEDVISNVLAISVPSAYGDEVLILPGQTPGSPVPVGLGDSIKVAVVNFPAHVQVKVYIGYKVAGTLVTDGNGAAVGYIAVPDLPGVDNAGHRIEYTVRAMATDPSTHGTLVGVAANGQDYYIEIGTKAYAYWSPRGYGVNGDYLVNGKHTVTVVIEGLSPFAKVSIYEEIYSVEYDILENYDVYQPVVVRGSIGPGYFKADADGVLEVQYTVDYYDLVGKNHVTGDAVGVYVNAATATGVSLLVADEVAEYKMIFPATAVITQVISSPANLTNKLETAGPFQVVHPGDYIEVEFNNLVPGACYTITLDGAAVQMYDTTNAPISCAAANSTGSFTVRFTVPNSRSVIGFNEVDVLYVGGVAAGESAGSYTFIASSPREDLYGSARVYVYPTVASPGDTIYIVGVNFESYESLVGGFSTIGTPQSGQANEHGAVAFQVTVPNVPAGTYAVYIERTVTYETFTTTIQVVPAVVSVSGGDSVLAKLYKAAGETVTITVKGLEPNRAYMVYWSDNPNTLGKPITDTGVPGYGTPLTWFSDSNGELTVTFKVPFGVIYKAYYASIVPADNPTTRVLEPIEIIIVPGEYFSVEESPYVIAGQAFTVDFDFAGAYASGELASLFAGFYNTSLQQADVKQALIMLATYGKAYAVLTMPDGSVDVVQATMQPMLDEGMLKVTFRVPNLQEAGVVGLSIGFALTYVPAIYNTSSEFDYPLYNTGYIELPVGGIEVIEGGGTLLASVTGQLATVVSSVNNAVNVITTTVNKLKPVIMQINDTVVYMNTTLGTVVAGIDELKGMIDNSTMKLVNMGNEVMAEIDTQSGKILANLNALAEMVNESYVELEGGQAKILSKIGELTMDVSDLAQLVHSMGNEVMAEIDSVNASLAHLIVMEGGEVIAELNTTITQLKPLIVALNGTIAQLQTTLGTLQADLGKLLEGQAMIEKLIVNQSGAVIAVINTTAGKFNATLTAALQMLEEGMAKLGSQAMAQLSAISDKIDTQATALSTKLDSIMASLSDLSSSVSTLSDKVDAVKATLSDVDSKLGSVSSSISTLSGKVDAVSKKLGDLSTTLSTGLSSLNSKATTIQSSIADVKSTLTDVKSTVSSLPGQISSVKSSVDNLAKSVNSLSSKVDTAVSESSTAKSRATVLGGTTAGLVIVNIIITALALARRPE